MECIAIDSIDVKGIAVRTDNASEMNADTAQIGQMWQTFFTDIAPLLSENSRVYGLYTNYESDHNGAFDVVACASSLNTDNLASYRIQAGHNLVFKGTGQIPQAVIDLWGEVWQYFASPNCQHQRAFTTDFELYKSESDIDIYIAVQ